jgi:hypothetical protein
MANSLFKVSVLEGDAVVAREGGVVAVASPVGELQEAFVDELLSLLTGAADETTSGTDIVRRVGALVTLGLRENVPAFALVAGVGEDVVALASGDAQVRVSREGGRVELSGLDSTTYVERVVHGVFDQLLISVGVPGEVDRRSNLTGGVVRGSGLLLVPAESGSLSAIPEETMVSLTPSEPAFDPIPLVEPTFTSIPLVDEAIEESQPVVVPEPASVTSVEVQGIMCSRQHFNNPESRFCAQCGISMVHQTHHLVVGARPPLGVLVLDDGTILALTTDLVVGREPENAEEVRAGLATGVELEDPKGSMSRIHARVILDGWDVRVADANSANGTFVAATLDADWTRLPPGVPTTIAPGARISWGGRTATFESHQKR